MKSSTLDRVTESTPTNTEAMHRTPWIDRVKQQLDHLALGTADISSAVSGAVRVQSMALPINVWKMRVRLSANQNIASGGALVTIPFDTVDYDSTGSFDTGTSQWTCPKSGYYKMVGKANYSTGAGLKWALFLVRFYANGVRITEGVQVNAGDFTGTAGQILNTGYDTMTDDAPYLNAGDVVDLRTTQQNSGAGNLVLNSGLFTYAVIHLLSG